MKSTKFKTQYNSLPDPGEINTLPSLTVPDQTMSIAEMVMRHRRGLPVFGNASIPVYHEDESGEPILLPDYKHLDLAERQELLEKAKADIDRLRRDLNRLEYQRRQDAIKKQAEERSNVQRTSGGAADQGSNSSSGHNPISAKNRPAGEADTQSPSTLGF